MVYCGGRIRFCNRLVIGAVGVVGRLGCGSGVLTGVMERIRWCRPCGWESVLGCSVIFCHVLVCCGSRFAVVRVGGGCCCRAVRGPPVLVTMEWLCVGVWVDWVPCAEMVVPMRVLGV